MQLSSVLHFLENNIWACTPEHAETIRTLANLAISGDLPRVPKEDVGYMPAADLGAFTKMGLSTGSQDNEVILTENGTAIVPMRGTIAPKMNLMSAWSGGISAEMATRTFRALASDERVKQVILDIDSPGGSVLGLEDARKALIELRDKKHVRAVANGLMASAAYYIGSAAQDIYVNSSTMIGSIGTIATFTSESRRLEDEGLDVTIVRSGKLKAVPHPAEPLSDKGLELMRDDVEKFVNEFYQAISENLGISMSKAKKLANDGAIEYGNDAVDAGLANKEGDLEAAASDAAGEISLTEQVDALSAQLEAATDVIAGMQEDEDELTAQIDALETSLEEMAGELAEATKAGVDAEIKAIVQSAVNEFKIGALQVDEFVELGSNIGVDNLTRTLSLMPANPELSKSDTSLQDDVDGDGVVPEEFANDPHFPRTAIQKRQYRQYASLRAKYGKHLDG
jgi:signal peptide peptidase SppA